MTARACAGGTLAARALFETSAWARAAVTGSRRPSSDCGIVASDEREARDDGGDQRVLGQVESSAGRCSRQRRTGIVARRGQYAPRPLSTAGIVRAMIEMSSQIDHASM